MTPQEVYRCIEAVLGLPLSKQVVCVRFAAEVSAPVWREWCKQRGVEDHSGELLDTFVRWLSGAASDGDLDRVAVGLYESLPKDVHEEDEPAVGFSGWALFDIAMIALDQCEEVHDSILHTSICYSAAAYCRVGIEAVSVSLDRLTPPELQFLKRWWQHCCGQFPELAGNTTPT